MKRWLRNNQGFAGGRPLMRLSWDGHWQENYVQMIAVYKNRYYACITNPDLPSEIIQINYREFDFGKRRYLQIYEDVSGVVIHQPDTENFEIYYDDFIAKIIADINNPFDDTEREFINITTIICNMQFEDLFI